MLSFCGGVLYINQAGRVVVPNTSCTLGGLCHECSNLLQNSLLALGSGVEVSISNQSHDGQRPR